jgi:hypothetical protein
MRDPTPETAERLATGAGDLATGVASMMRAFSAMSGSRRPPPARSRPAPPPPDPDLAWSAATRTGAPPDRSDPAPGDDASPWAAATHAAAREQQAAARERAESAAREKAAAARERAEAARRRVQETAAAARRADSGRSGAWTGGPPAGQDVWAAATADRGDAGAPARPRVDHDVPGDDARPHEA